MSERGWMEYGSEFDWKSNDALFSDTPQGFVQDDWQLYRSGRDAMKAAARIIGGRRVLLPTLCCESMILPFSANGYDVDFYRLNPDLTGDEAGEDITEVAGGDGEAELRAGGQAALFD